MLTQKKLLFFFKFDQANKIKMEQSVPKVFLLIKIKQYCLIQRLFSRLQFKSAVKLGEYLARGQVGRSGVAKFRSDKSAAWRKTW